MTNEEYSALNGEQKADYLISQFNGRAAADVPVEVYKLVAKELTEDMRNLDQNKKFLFVGPTGYTPAEIARNLEERTEFGLQFAENYVAGLKFFRGDKPKR